MAKSSSSRSPSASIAAEVNVLADGINGYRSRIAGLAEPLVGTPADDLISALHEAERALKTAHRALERAVKLAR